MGTEDKNMQRYINEKISTHGGRRIKNNESNENSEK